MILLMFCVLDILQNVISILAIYSVNPKKNCSFGFCSLCKYYKVRHYIYRRQSKCNFIINTSVYKITALQERPHYNLFCPRKCSTTKLKTYYFPQHGIFLASGGKNRQMCLTKTSKRMSTL
uniref:Secreted protein n=1 Tax=Molossus molossus TaxID=27622 RepID=A0A7J8FSU1_MOLMO|nr:hypothetical protein HJG59_008363 [Molossus molossus]